MKNCIDLIYIKILVVDKISDKNTLKEFVNYEFLLDLNLDFNNSSILKKNH